MPTLLAYRNALQRALDDVGLYDVTSATATSVTCKALINSATSASSGRYNGAYVYVQSGTAAGVQGTVKENGYTASTGTLIIQDSSGFDTTPGSDSVIEITRLFPSIAAGNAASTQGEDGDYRSLVNRALSYLLVPDQVSVTTVADQQEYSLSTYAAWLDRPERLVAVLDPPRATGWPTKRTWRRWELNVDGPTPSLVFLDRAYPTSGATFRLRNTSSSTGMSSASSTRPCAGWSSSRSLP